MAPAKPKVDAQLARTLEALNFCFVLADCREPDCPITYASPAFHELTGYPADEVIGRNCRFLQGPETSRQKVMEMRDAIREERSSAICLINYKRTGDKFWNQFYLAPVRDENDCVSHYIGIQSDVTDLMHQAETLDATDSQELESESSNTHQQCFPDVVQVEQQEAADLNGLLRLHSDQRQKSISKSVSFGGAATQELPSSLLAPLMKLQQSFVLVDPRLPDCPIVHASTAFLLMTGYPREQVLGRNCRFLQGAQTDKAEVQRMRDAMAADPPRAVTVKLLNYKVNGQPFWNALHIAPIRSADGRVMYYVGVQLDITAPPTPKHDHIPAQHQSSRFQPTQDGLNQQDGFGTRDGQQSKQYQTDPQQEQVQRLAPLQSPAASEQAQHHQQPEGMSSSTDAAAEKQERQQEQPQAQQQECHEGHRQLLHRQSAPAGSSFAAAAARATMLPDVSHLHINTHASHAAQKLAGLPECGEVTVRHRVEQKGVVGAVRVACRSLAADGLRRSVEDQCVTGSPRMTRHSGSFARTALQAPRHTV